MLMGLLISSLQVRLWWLCILFYWLCITLHHLQQAADHLSLDVLSQNFHPDIMLL